MLRLMEEAYENISEEVFEADLAEKDWVIQLRDPASGALCGFSTQMLVPLEVAGREVTVLFSGDTVIARAHWGDAALSHVWGNLVLRLLEEHEAGSLYWVLISKGYKTYRFLPVFFHEFYPRHDAATPGWAEAIIGAFGERKFGGAFDAAAGIVRAYAGKDRLREGVAEVTAERMLDPHVAYFVRRNPGHAAGDELCCVAPLSRENFTPAAYRVIHARPAGMQAQA